MTQTNISLRRYGVQIEEIDADHAEALFQRGGQAFAELALVREEGEWSADAEVTTPSLAGLGPFVQVWEAQQEAQIEAFARSQPPTVTAYGALVAYFTHKTRAVSWKEYRKSKRGDKSR